MPANQGAIAPATTKSAAIAQQTKQKATEAVGSAAGFGTTFMTEVITEAQQVAKERLTGQKKAMVGKVADRLVAAVQVEADVIGDFFGENLSGLVGEALNDWGTGAIDVPTN